MTNLIDKYIDTVVDDVFQIIKKDTNRKTAQEFQDLLLNEDDPNLAIDYLFEHVGVSVAEQVALRLKDVLKFA